jgi:ATP-dependent Clp protease ATP-binding subunit ClpC
VFNILLQVMEEGKLTDSQGRRVDFRNTILIMTSNIGAAQISKNQSLGFTIGDEHGLSYDDMKARVMSELKKVFRPELLNRIEEVIVFHKLDKDEIKTIIDLMLKRLRTQMAEHEVTIELTDAAKDLLVENGYDPAMGARPLRRALQRLIEDPLADFVLGAELMPGAMLVVDRKGETEEVQITIVPAPERAEPEAEKVTVPAEEPAEEAEPEAEPAADES